MGEIHKAMWNDNFVRVIQLVERNPSDVNRTNAQGDTPLHLIYKNEKNDGKDDKRLSLLQLLLKKGANVNSISSIRGTPLLIATFYQKIEVVKLLLEYGADPNTLNKFYLKALKTDELTRRQNIVEAWKCGADVNQQNITKRTPLIVAASHNNFHCLKLLVEAGAHVNIKSEKGDTALSMACKTGNKEMIEYLLKHGAEIKTYYDTLHTPLHILATNSNKNDNIKDIVHMLLENGVNIDDQDHKGRTALLLALIHEQDDLTHALIKGGANVCLVDEEDNSPLHTILKNIKKIYSPTNYSIMCQLIEAGAHLTADDGLRYTLLQYAVNNNLMEVVNKILAKITGIEKNKLNSNQNLKKCFENESTSCISTLAVAIVLEYEEVVDHLIDLRYESKTQLDDRKCTPPLYYALKMRNYNITKTLLEADFYTNRSFFRIANLLINFSSNERKDVLLVSLLWILLKKSFLNKLMRHCFKNNSKFKDILRIFILLIAIHLRSNTKIDYFNIIKHSHTEVAVWICNKIEELEKEEICGKKSVFDIFNMSFHSLVRFFNSNENFYNYVLFLQIYQTVKHVRELEINEILLVKKISFALERRKLYNSATIVLNETFKHILQKINYTTLPEEITFNILSYLNPRDLRKIASNE